MELLIILCHDPCKAELDGCHNRGPEAAAEADLINESLIKSSLSNCYCCTLYKGERHSFKPTEISPPSRSFGIECDTPNVRRRILKSFVTRSSASSVLPLCLRRTSSLVNRSRYWKIHRCVVLLTVSSTCRPLSAVCLVIGGLVRVTPSWSTFH